MMILIMNSVMVWSTNERKQVLYPGNSIKVLTISNFNMLLLVFEQVDNPSVN